MIRLMIAIDLWYGIIIKYLIPGLGILLTYPLIIVDMIIIAPSSS